ncbi:hypothetical protein QMG83_01670 [Salinibacterium sp. G-O1]|uniref:hypothetical protein n=1 Tax=Salinibacterium sp. G-O1 TaxID=3046208 RepID=UPI0024BA9925|nr:hypothetical protein [Salinibacterium sp. G-O1]MDJ0333924.1 hypothetical protein [Salinibacterium sp. G-O1]
MSDTRDFDPRFDPAFQRGYVEGASTAPNRVQRPPAVGLPPEPLAAAAPPAPDARSAAVGELQAHPESPAVSLVGNPWIRVLWIIAPVFIIGGLAGQAWAQSRMFGGFSSNGPDVVTSYIVPAVAQSICPWMVLIGLAALVGVVFLHAVRWRAAE